MSLLDDLRYVYVYDPSDNSHNCGRGCNCSDCNDGDKPTCNKSNDIKEFDTHSAPPEVGKCPQCFSGKLVALFGPRRYCNVCGYKE